jgi:carbamoyltransferase
MVVVCLQRPGSDPDEAVRRNRLFGRAGADLPILTIPHHLGHAVGAFATSGFAEAALLIVDGVGSPCEDLSAGERAVICNPAPNAAEIISLYRASGAAIVPLEKHVVKDGAWLTAREEGRAGPAGMPLFGSLGGMYGAVARQIFGDTMDGAGKVMGLAPYGEPILPVDEFFSLVEGRFAFSDRAARRFPHDDRWPARREEYAHLAASVQAALEEGLLYLARRLRAIGGSGRLCYAGGVALNSVANERLLREGVFDEVFIMPAAEDSGAAIGAAYHGLWQMTGRSAARRLPHDAVGRAYTAAEIDRAIDAAPALVATTPRDAIDEAVDQLCEGKIVGWFDGRSELGPRALGQRSILCDPRRADAKEMLNRRVKHREGFRPFAPAVLLEQADPWFDLDGTSRESPFMLRVARFREDKAALVPAVAHVDGTGRLQTVTAEANGRFHALIERFFARTGVPMVLNTSFNVAGEPLVETPDDALFCLLYTGLDCCVLGDRIVHKEPGFRSILDLAVEVVADWIDLSWPARGGAACRLGSAEAGAPDLSGERWGAGPMRRPPSGASLDAEAALVAHAEALGAPYVTLRVTTPWGRAVQLVEPAALSVLRYADGRTTGRRILELASAKDNDAISEASLVRALGWLRRARAIAFRAVDAAARPARAGSSPERDRGA